MYNAHRGIPGPAQPSSRIIELLDALRAEFDGQGARLVDSEHQRKILIV